VFHAATNGTLQLGQPAWIAERTGLPVVADLRARDVAAGGQGAPLVSLLDTLLLAGRAGTPAALNLGGIANLTVPPIAFDTGPANALLDAAARHFTGRPYDEDGRLAAAGTVNREWLGRLLEDPYYARPAPKSTGKEHFHAGYVAFDGRAEDVLATLTRLTARTVADAARRHGVTEVITSGGGVRNPALMAALREELAPARLVTSEALGLPAQAKEAYAFALLGFLTHHGIAGTLPSATGARHASVLGSVTPGSGSRPAPRVMRLQ
jgi:anhydro-N-acetylmuramic acid kinase